MNENRHQSPPIWERWVRLARGGDTDAFQKLYHHFYEPMMSIACTLCPTRTDAEHVLQDSFIK